MDDWRWCAECDLQQPVVEESDETTGALEAERHYHVIRLECGHEIATPTTYRPTH